MGADKLFFNGKIILVRAWKRVSPWYLLSALQAGFWESRNTVTPLPPESPSESEGFGPCIPWRELNRKMVKSICCLNVVNCLQRGRGKFVDCQTQLICTWVFICSMTKLKEHSREICYLSCSVCFFTLWTVPTQYTKCGLAKDRRPPSPCSRGG